MWYIEQLQYMQKTANNMKYLHLFSFIILRNVSDHRAVTAVPVIFILNFLNKIGLSTVEALLSGTISITVAYKPIDFEQGSVKKWHE